MNKELHAYHFSATKRNRPAEENQDAWFADSEAKVFAIADGVGSPLCTPGEASQFAMRTLEDIIEHRRMPSIAELRHIEHLFAEIHEHLLDPAQSADSALRELELPRSGRRPATTLSVLQMEEYGNQERLRISWTGSDRLYGVTDAGAILLTEDHTAAFASVLSGTKDLDKAKQSADAAQMTHVLGGFRNDANSASFHVDSRQYPLDKFHRLLLVSDGAHSVVPEKDLA